MKTFIIGMISSMTSPVQGATATAYSIFEFAGQAGQAKGQFEKYKGISKWNLK